MKDASVSAPVLAWYGAEPGGAQRTIPAEAPVAFVYNGSTYAVMMATPADMEDFATGFALSEGIVGDARQLGPVEIVRHAKGIEARFFIDDASAKRLAESRRAMAGPTGCGLCGAESLQQAIRPVAPLASDNVRLPAAGLMSAMLDLRGAQSLHAQTRATHAAALTDGEGILLLREDVGRHNALDKLIGAALNAELPLHDKAVLMTSRVSVELVLKAARVGIPILAAASAPTALALETAQDAGLTLIGLLREDGLAVFSGAQRIA